MGSMHKGVSMWGMCVRSARGGLCVGVSAQGDLYTTRYKGKSTLLVRGPEAFKSQAGNLKISVGREHKIQLWGKLAEKKHNHDSFSLQIKRQIP